MKFLDFLKEYWFLIVFMLGAIGTGAAYLFSMDGRMFKDVDERIKVVKYVEDSPSAEQKQRAYFMDSINQANAIKSRARRDSLMLIIANRNEAMEKRIQHMDSINLLNAAQVYQIKEQLKQEE